MPDLTDVDAARMLLAAAEYPARWITRLNPSEPRLDEKPAKPLMAVTVDDVKIDPSPALLAAQVHATLALVDELRMIRMRFETVSP